MRRAAPDEDRSEHERRGERAEHACVEPAPFRALHDRQDERGDRQRQHERARQVGHPPAAGRTALDQMAAREHHRRDADRHVDEEHEPPVAGGDQQPAERGAEPGRRRGDRGQQRHAVRSALGRERVEHQGKRRRDEKRRPERLQHPERRQRAGRRGDRAQHRRDREQLEPADEDPAAPDEVGQASRRDEEGREDDVVGVEHPRQLRDRRLGIRARDSGKAMLTIVASMNAIAAPIEQIANTVRGCGPRRRPVPGGTTGGACLGAVRVAISLGASLR